MTEELSFKFYLILINFNLNSHMWLVGTVLDNAALDHQYEMPRKLFTSCKVLGVYVFIKISPMGV